MPAALVPGATRTERIDIDIDRTIGFLGDEWRVYATPAMVNDVEYACWRLIQEHLDDAQTTVGVHVALEHLAATPLGESVEVRVEVVSVEDRRIVCEAVVADAAEVVGRGEHTRFVVDVARHRRRIEAKRAKLAR
ncbi:MAG: hotdog domain-containing protein [Gammaproteobacteria bacterium]|nr:hotdog domain-containing protein [Gammaproteobacteria bacterium]